MSLIQCHFDYVCSFCYPCLTQKLLLYPDDSAILVSDKDVTSIELLLQKELLVVSEWLIDNKLSLHLGKQSLFYLDPNLGYGLNLS